jgi:hypothetical protein
MSSKVFNIFSKASQIKKGRKAPYFFDFHYFILKDYLTLNKRFCLSNTELLDLDPHLN